MALTLKAEMSKIGNRCPAQTIHRILKTGFSNTFSVVESNRSVSPNSVGCRFSLRFTAWSRRCQNISSMYLLTTSPCEMAFSYHSHRANDIIDNDMKFSMFIEVANLLRTRKYAKPDEPNTIPDGMAGILFISVAFSLLVIDTGTVPQAWRR
jgi:hypothetical protein